MYHSDRGYMLLPRETFEALRVKYRYMYTSLFYVDIITHSYLSDTTEHGVEVKRGQLLATVTETAKTFGYPRRAVRKAIKQLVTEGIIERTVLKIDGHLHMLITLINFDIYDPETNKGV